MARDYRREYAAARRRAQERGFRSVAAQRHVPRLPKNLSAHRNLPEEARWTRTATSKAIEMSRATGLPLEVTAELVGGLGGRLLPAAPFEDDAARWPDIAWYNRLTGGCVRVSAIDPAGDPAGLERALAHDVIPVRTLGDVVSAYDLRPEHKSLAPNGSPAGARTTGLLRRRAIRSSPALTRLSGKEGNKLLQRAIGETTEPSDYRTEFGEREDPWNALVVPTLKRMGAVEVVNWTHVTWRRSIERILRDGHRPKSALRERTFVAVALGFARDRLGDASREDGLAALADYLALPELALGRLCNCGCGQPARSPRALWCSEAHRKRAGRRQRESSPGRPNPRSRIESSAGTSTKACGGRRRAAASR